MAQLLIPDLLPWKRPSVPLHGQHPAAASLLFFFSYFFIIFFLLASSEMVLKKHLHPSFGKSTYGIIAGYELQVHVHAT